MKYALVDGQRQEALPNLSGKCPSCEQPMVAKCGDVRVSHWAHHRKTVQCDPWWENETAWHRNWKGQFPVNWQEYVFRAESGEKHIADVRTDHDWVIEFQHSYLKPEERRSRDAFYRKLAWVVDGTRRKTDGAQFRKVLEASPTVGIGGYVRRVHTDDSGLLREWAASPAPIFFDFGPGPTLWWLLARRLDEPAYVAPFSKSNFIAIHYGQGPEGARNFDEFVRAIDGIVAPYNANLRSQALARPVARPTSPQPFVTRRSIRRRL